MSTENTTTTADSGRLPAADCSALSRDEARRKMYSMSFKERIAFVRGHGWPTEDQANWFRPGWGWNYCTDSAVVCILMYPPSI